MTEAARNPLHNLFHKEIEITVMEAHWRPLIYLIWKLDIMNPRLDGIISKVPTIILEKIYIPDNTKETTDIAQKTDWLRLITDNLLVQGISIILGIITAVTLTDQIMTSETHKPILNRICINPGSDGTLAMTNI